MHIYTLYLNVMHTFYVYGYLTHEVTWYLLITFQVQIKVIKPNWQNLSDENIPFSMIESQWLFKLAL